MALHDAAMIEFVLHWFVFCRPSRPTCISVSL